MTAGSMVGHLATRSFGQYDLPVPRRPGDELSVLVGNVDGFADEWASAATTCGCGCASTRSPTTRCSACPTCGPG